MEVTEERFVPFGEVDGWKLTLNLYQPPVRGTPRPAVLLIPGWGEGPVYMEENARAMAAAGYVVFGINCRPFWPEFLDDTQLAVRWVRSNAATYHVDPNRLGTYGHSAGGQLAALCGVRDTRDATTATLAGYSSKVACVVDLAGFNDIAVLEADPAQLASEAALLSITPEELLNDFRDLFPATLVDEHSAPMLLMHGGNDTYLSPDHSRNLAIALQTAGVEVVYHYIPDVLHGSIQDWDLGGELTLAFLNRHLHPEQ